MADAEKKKYVIGSIVAGEHIFMEQKTGNPKPIFILDPSMKTQTNTALLSSETVLNKSCEHFTMKSDTIINVLPTT